MLRSGAVIYQPSPFHGGLARREMLPFIPRATSSILDVGCSHGRFGSVLKEANPDWHVTGIEPDPEAAEDASLHYDKVITGFYPDDLDRSEAFDCIIFNDVLEHVVDPWTMLRKTIGHLSPDGRLVASIPNVRFVIVARDLVLRGRFDYADWGILDRTHLRFFTRHSIQDLFVSTGFVIELLSPINPTNLRKASLLVGPFRDMRFQQFAVVARPADGTT